MNLDGVRPVGKVAGHPHPELENDVQRASKVSRLVRSGAVSEFALARITTEVRAQTPTPPVEDEQIAITPEEQAERYRQKMLAPIAPSPAKYPIAPLPPITCKTHTICGYKAAAAETRGARDYMEDRHVVTTLTVKGKQIPLFAVMDGHGGSATAELIKKHLPDLMTEQLNNFDWETADDLKMHCFWKVVSEDLEELLEKKLQSEYKKDYSGSTLTCSLILNHTLWVLNTGDSRTVLCNNGAARQLSRDACFDDPLFANSIIKHGGKIETANGAKRLWGELGVARSFGDLQYRGIIPIRTLREDGQIHTGMISRFKIKKVEDLESVMEEGKVFLVLATDGLWDRVGSEEAAIFADECEKADEAANKLVKKALKRQSGDNITVVVVYLVAQSAHAEGNQPPGGSQCTPPSQLPTQDLGTPDA